VYALAAGSTGGGTGMNLFAGTYGGGVFLSTNSGAHWTEINAGLTNLYVRSLALSGQQLLVGTDGGVFRVAKVDTSWSAVSVGLTASEVSSIAFNGPVVLAGTLFDGVFKRPLSEVLLSAGNTGPEMPGSFRLEQNFPNPFNPATTVEFRIEHAALTDLKVYDLLGREVSALVHGVKAPGIYSVSFDGAGLASGVYYYRLTSGERVATRKMILIR
jgi:hypothetical protein